VLIRTLASVTGPGANCIKCRGNDAFRARDELRSGLCYLPQDLGIYLNPATVEFLEPIGSKKAHGSEPAGLDPCAAESALILGQAVKLSRDMTRQRALDGELEIRL
jgi:hypothetical protein